MINQMYLIDIYEDKVNEAINYIYNTLYPIIQYSADWSAKVAVAMISSIAFYAIITRVIKM
jgi:hypothetical protein